MAAIAVALGGATAVGSTAAVSRAAGIDAEACANAAESAQDLRWAGRLVEAGATLRTCLDPACPTFVRTDCARWSADLNETTPTVVVRARADDGHDLVAVRVSVDGRVIADVLDGRARALDPGAHRFRFETPGGAPAEQVILLREGEKLRLVDVVIPTRPAPDAGSPLPPTRAVARARPRPGIGSVAAWALGGCGVALAAAGVWLVANGLSGYHDMQRSCGATGSCSSSDVERARIRVWAGDASLLAGGLLVGGGVWLGVHADGSGARVTVGGSL